MIQQLKKLIWYKRLFVISIVLLSLVVISVIVISFIMNSSDFDGSNSDYKRIEDYGEKETKSFSFDKFDTLYFFSENYMSQRTIFLDQIPNLKIVNSPKYSVEVSASKTLIEELHITTIENSLVITFKKENYNEILKDGWSYDGLYVDCNEFNVTVYAPISEFYSSTIFNLDFEAPKTNRLAIVMGGEIQEGNIHGIDSNVLICSLRGASTVELAGRVTGQAFLEVRHDSKIHADQLIADDVSTLTSCQMFGFCYISGSTFSDYPFGSLGFLITVGIVLLFIISIVGIIAFRVLFVKQRNKMDTLIAKKNKDNRNLIKTQ